MPARPLISTFALFSLISTAQAPRTIRYAPPASDVIVKAALRRLSRRSEKVTVFGRSRRTNIRLTLYRLAAMILLAPYIALPPNRLPAHPAPPATAQPRHKFREIPNIFG